MIKTICIRAYHFPWVGQQLGRRCSEVDIDTGIKELRRVEYNPGISVLLELCHQACPDYPSSAATGTVSDESDKTSKYDIGIAMLDSRAVAHCSCTMG